MDSKTLEIIFQISVAALSATGGLFFMYMLCGCILKSRGDLYIKGNTYLVLDVDEIGEKLEYYVRKIKNDIDGRYIYISRIILYSKNSSDSCEIYKICRILAENNNNIIFLNDVAAANGSGGNPDILSVISSMLS